MAVAVARVQFNQDDVRAVLDAPEVLDATSSLADDRHPWVLFDKRSKSGANDRMIAHQKDANGRFPGEYATLQPANVIQRDLSRQTYRRFFCVVVVGVA